MNISIPGYSETSPTQFTIQVSYEHTTYNIKKRYSDFVDFDGVIQDEMGEPAPVELPGKKWFGAASREFLDTRRRGLEQYMRAIAKRDEWRESLAFMDFIELSAHVKSEVSKDAQARADWIKKVDEAATLVRQAAVPNIQSAEQRRLTVLAGSTIKQLEAILHSDVHLGDGEYRRRRDMVQQLSKTLRHLTTPGAANPNMKPWSADSAAVVSNGRSSSPSTSKGRVLGAETDRTRNLSNAGLLQLQQSDMENQDRTVQELLQTIKRQKQLGLDIHTELEHQNQLLNDLDDDTHRINSRLNQARRRTNNIS